MRMNSASTLDGDAGEKQIVAVEELAGTWRGWVTRGEGQEQATMYVSAEGSYRSLTTGGASTEGKRGRQRRIRADRVIERSASDGPALRLEACEQHHH